MERVCRTASWVLSRRGHGAALLGAMLCATGACVSLAVGQAGATTGGANYPEPHVFVPAKVQAPVVGRYYVKAVDRRAKIVSGQLDLAATSIQFPEFLVGEIALRMYSAKGTPTTVLEDLYPWQFAGSRLSAPVTNPASFGTEHPEGVKIGEISLIVPRKDLGVGGKATEAQRLSGTLALNGRGPYKISFIRGNEHRAPPNPLPRAKQLRP